MRYGPIAENPLEWLPPVAGPDGRPKLANRIDLPQLILAGLTIAVTRYL